MRLIYGNDEAVAKFVASLIPFCAERGFDTCTAIGVASADRLIGGFVFHDYAPEFGVIEISFASLHKRWLTRSVLHGVFSYVFDEMGCQMACSRTPASYASALRMIRSYGFRQVRVPRLFGRNEDGIISTLTVEDWRCNGFHKPRFPPKSPDFGDKESRKDEEYTNGQIETTQAARSEQDSGGADGDQYRQRHCRGEAQPDQSGDARRNAHLFTVGRI